MSDFHFSWIPGEREQVLLLLHGTGGDERSLLEVGQAIAPGWNLLGVRGQVDENGANRYFRRFAEGVFDHEDLARRTRDLAAWLQDPVHPWHGKPLVAFGYSNGANMGANLVLTGTGVLEGAVMLRPNVPSEPVDGLNLAGFRGLVLVGAQDTICPPEDGERLASLLTAAGGKVQSARTGVGHNLTQADFRASAEFLATW